VRLARAVRFALLVALSLSAAPRRALAQFIVVVHADNPVAAISRAELADYMLGKVSSWPHGAAVVPVDQPVNSRIRQLFSLTVLRQPAAAVRTYWQQQQFAGRGTTPPQVASDREVLEFIRRSPGSIGYITASAPIQPGTRALVVVP
jgi:ABC-type phosphate transport system substrate-binding protein